MNITFFIGNGFDINLGLNSRYSDFYPYFMSHASNDNMIKNWLAKDEMQWADLEAKLGEKLDLVDDNNLAKFYESNEEMDLCLIEYLETEQAKISVLNKDKEIANEMTNSLIRFAHNLPELGRNAINAICNKYRGEAFQYCFIDFNYTNTLDQIVAITKKLKTPITTHKNGGITLNNNLGNVLHIHGTLESEMILGVNDKDQINSNFLRSNNEFLDIFIKQRINESIGQQKIDHVKDILNESHIVCIFGMSIGKTDKMWWIELTNWLKKDSENVLLIYHFGDEDELIKGLPSKTIRLSNIIKERLLKHSGISKESADFIKLSKQIFIAFNAPIFNFKNILFNKNATLAHMDKAIE